MRIDLHLHSTASDGALDPGALVARARDGALDLIALTDHDTAAGVPAALAAAGDGIAVIPAIEISARHEQGEIHVLGYFRDVADPLLIEYAERARGAREIRIMEMIDRLAGLDIEIEFDDVLAEAGPNVASLARPHLARALRTAGHVRSVAEAFDRFLGDEGPAYVATRLLDAAAAIELIHAAGGVAVWAHPPPQRLDPMLPGLVALGLDGLECHRPRLPPTELKPLLDAARRHGLLVTGGSDWHGDWHGELGAFHLTEVQVGGLLERLA